MKNESDYKEEGCGRDALPGIGCGSMDRRAFVGNGALAAALLAMTACNLNVAGPQSISFGPTVTGPITVGDYPDLASVGGVALIDFRGTPVAIERTGETTFIALSRICPHQGGIVNPVGNGFICPRHGSRYDSTGKWIGGQPTTGLRSLATSYDASTDTLTIG